jgi:hypothetical protein
MARSVDGRLLADRDITSLAQSGIEVAFLFIHSPGSHLHVQELSNRGESCTQSVQYVLNGLAAHNMRACAVVLCDDFTGSSSRMQSFEVVDRLLDFNASRAASDAGFTCVSTDLELTAGYRGTTVYGLWKHFHSCMREHIASRSSDLKLFGWMQGPDFLIANMDHPTDRTQLMQRENIRQDPADSTLYGGARGTSLRRIGKPIFDATRESCIHWRAWPLLDPGNHGAQYEPRPVLPELR